MTEVVISGVTGALEEKRYQRGTFFKLAEDDDDSIYLLTENKQGAPLMVDIGCGHRGARQSVTYNDKGYSSEDITRMFYGYTKWVEVKKITISVEV